MSPAVSPFVFTVRAVAVLVCTIASIPVVQSQAVILHRLPPNPFTCQFLVVVSVNDEAVAAVHSPQQSWIL